MRRWSFLKDQLPIFLNHPRVSYVVICDETGEDIEAICEAGLDMNPKLKLYANDTVLGVYGNKRKCMLSSISAIDDGTDWVAILDSDNRFDAGFIDAFFAAVSLESDTEKSKKTIYCPGKIERLFLDTGKTEDKTSQFSGMTIDRNNWNSILGKQGWNFLLNNGNAVWPSSVARFWPDLPESGIVGTDSIFAMRQAILAGYSLRVEPTMRYLHTVHDGSHWLQNAEVSTRLMIKTDWRVHSS